MKNTTFFFLVVLLLSCSPKHEPDSNSINPIIGDQSFLSKFGTLPDETVDDELRIATHLAYAAQILEERDMSYLSPEMQKRRMENINFLKEYVEQGIFPRNYDYRDERKPCFIDRDGRICAVGYLVEKSGSRTIAEQINVMHQYDEIEEMDSELLAEWVAESGLTKEECAIIQPTYYPNRAAGYIRASRIPISINAGMLTLNSIDLINKRRRTWASLTGMGTGALQAVYFGIGEIPDPLEREYLENYYPEWLAKKQRMVNANIIMGTTTFLVSGSGLIFNRKKNNKDVSWNLFSIPQTSESFAMGLHFSKRF